MGPDLKKPNIGLEVISNGTITTVDGFYAAADHCGIKGSGKPDICIIYAPHGAVCSGVFTTNAFIAAPAVVSREQLKKNGTIKALVINSGIANACTGKQGHINAKKTGELAARYLEIGKDGILVSSTGVIGKQLPMEKIEKGIAGCSKKLSANGGHSAARAIMTTDTAEKEIAVKIKAAGGKEIIVGGIAKGSGMIEPDMATMLAFLTTNAGISKVLLDELLLEGTRESFNRITVDGCESTNDTVLVFANSTGGVEIKNKGDENYLKFRDGLFYVLKDLARKIVMDGEGATKFIEIEVINAENSAIARELAYKVANSNLFKTAVFGNDLNWGRINAALGSTGNNLDPDKVDIYFGRIMIVKNGTGIEYDRDAAGKSWEGREIKFVIDLKSGGAGFSVWTSDLSLDYIKINALYHN